MDWDRKGHAPGAASRYRGPRFAPPALALGPDPTPKQMRW